MFHGTGILKPDEFGLACNEKKASTEKFDQWQSVLATGKYAWLFLQLAGGGYWENRGGERAEMHSSQTHTQPETEEWATARVVSSQSKKQQTNTKLCQLKWLTKCTEYYSFDGWVNQDFPGTCGGGSHLILYTRSRLGTRPSFPLSPSIQLPKLNSFMLKPLKTGRLLGTILSTQNTGKKALFPLHFNYILLSIYCPKQEALWAQTLELSGGPGHEPG